MEYDYLSITENEIREGQDYPGVLVRNPETVGNARVVVQVYVGFGDAVAPDTVECDISVLLPHRASRFQAYP